MITLYVFLSVFGKHCGVEGMYDIVAIFSNLQGDVLLSFDNVPIANEGTVPFRAAERISFGFLISQK